MRSPEGAPLGRMRALPAPAPLSPRLARPAGACPPPPGPPTPIFDCGQSTRHGLGWKNRSAGRAAARQGRPKRKVARRLSPQAEGKSRAPWERGDPTLSAPFRPSAPSPLPLHPQALSPPACQPIGWMDGREEGAEGRAQRGGGGVQIDAFTRPPRPLRRTLRFGRPAGGAGPPRAPPTHPPQAHTHLDQSVAGSGRAGGGRGGRTKVESQGNERVSGREHKALIWRSERLREKELR